MNCTKLFVCCHQNSPVPEHPLLVPIQVGAALATEKFPGFLYDDDGENISNKNRSYCELTAQYWAWKNEPADYYGFFHYRRFLCPEAKAKRPYRIEKAPNENTLNKLNFDKMQEIIPQYDLILPKGENMYVSVREHYATAPFHHKGDMELVEKIVRGLDPSYADAMEAYFSGTVHYFGNIYIMRRQVFHDYCAWLFPILEEFDRQADISNYGTQERRVNGYLAERLFGVWLTSQRPYLCVCELPRVHFVPNKLERVKKRLIDYMLPPGSKRRAFVKKSARRTGVGNGI